MSRKFAGIDGEFTAEENAVVVLIPVEYDGTSTWQKGSDKGPDALLHAAENMELYDIETDSEPFEIGVHVTDPMKGYNSPEAMVDAVHDKVAAEIARDKFVTIIGGEHSISIGTIRAHAENYKDLTVLQIDAHADLRPEYDGSTCNHACAVYEASTSTNLIQVGIRSMDKLEKEYMNRGKVYFAHEIMDNDNWMKDAVGKMTDNVFITIDLDAIDPSELPSTGTPEPGGLHYYQLLKFLRLVCEEKNVIGFDIMELCPNADEKSSDFLAAKLYYKLLAYKFFL